jgi:hypothetical protein
MNLEFVLLVVLFSEVKLYSVGPVFSRLSFDEFFVIIIGAALIVQSSVCHIYRYFRESSISSSFLLVNNLAPAKW